MPLMITFYCPAEDTTDDEADDGATVPAELPLLFFFDFFASVTTTRIKISVKITLGMSRKPPRNPQGP